MDDYYRPRSRSHSRRHEDEQFVPIDRNHRSKSLDNRREFQRDHDDPFYDPPAGGGFRDTFHASIPKRHYERRFGGGGDDREGGDDFFNESITIPRSTVKVSPTRREMDPEKNENNWTSYDKSTRYHHEHTAYPPPPPPQYPPYYRYEEYGGGNRLLPPPQQAEISPRSYPESDYYQRAQQIQRPYYDERRSGDAASAYRTEQRYRPYSDYGGFDDQHESIYARTPRGGRLTMSEFALNYFRRPKGYDSVRGKNKKEWTWDDITSKVKYADKPISHSLLRLESSEADKMAQDTFLGIMRFMGDEPLKRGQTYTDCVYELLSVCHRFPAMRDEIYCQIIKQVSSNRSQNPDSLLKGWRLFGIITAYFDCSDVLKPYLLRYLSDIVVDIRRAYNGSAKICLDNLKHTFQFGGRKFILSAAEVEAITNGKSVKRQTYQLPGGHKKLIGTKSVTVAEEIVRELCLEMNIRSPAEQHEFCLCYILEKNGTMKILNNDEYIFDVTTELDVSDEEYVLLLTRSVWISPLRADSALYIDVLFFQIVPNYVTGLLNILPRDQLTAALLDDTAILGALLLLSDPYNQKEILTPEIVQNLIPKCILKRATITPEQWVGRVESKLRLLPNVNSLEARRLFLERLEKWPLFGASFFFVKKVNVEKIRLLEAIVAINKHGLHVLTTDQESVLQHSLNEIQTTNQYKISTGNYIDIRLNPNKENREVVSLETDNGSEIARVVAHYNFLIKEKDSLYVLEQAIASSEL